MVEVDQEKEWRRNLKPGDEVILRLPARHQEEFEVLEEAEVSRMNRHKVVCVGKSGRTFHFSKATGEDGWRLVVPTPELQELARHQAERSRLASTIQGLANSAVMRGWSVEKMRRVIDVMRSREGQS